MTLHEAQDTGQPICQTCGWNIDEETCWCGSDKNGYPCDLGHTFVPMGCTCGYVDAEQCKNPHYIKGAAMTDHHASLERVAREWVDMNGLGHHPYSNEMVGSLATLLASQRAAGLEAAAREARRRDRGAHKELYWLAEWLNAQAQEQRP